MWLFLANGYFPDKETRRVSCGSPPSTSILVLGRVIEMFLSFATHTRGLIQLLESIGNRGQGLPGEKPDVSRLSAIYAFNQNVEVTVSGLNYPDQVFVRLERISLGTLLMSSSRTNPRYCEKWMTSSGPCRNRAVVPSPDMNESARESPLSSCEAESLNPRAMISIVSRLTFRFPRSFQNVEVAAVQVRLGEFNAAFESLERAREKHDTNIIYLKVDPFWDDVRSDPRFQSLLPRMGLTT
jgi:hypothetical protein